MFAKYKATRQLRTMLDEYRDEYKRCEDEEEKSDLIDVIENLEWVIKELNDPDEQDTER